MSIPRDVEVRTADGQWQPATAVSEVEPTHIDGQKIHDFPVVWVRFSTSDRRMPWPADAVREVSS